MQPDIRDHIEWLKHRVKDHDREIRRMIERSHICLVNFHAAAGA